MARELDKYDPRNCPAYNNMLDLCHYTGDPAILQEFPEDTILAGGRSFGPFKQEWAPEEIIECLNEDLVDPKTCRYCMGDGWTDGQPRQTGSVPKQPCDYCQVGKSVQEKLREKWEEEKASKRAYLQRELDRLSIEYEQVEKQLMELE